MAYSKPIATTAPHEAERIMPRRPRIKWTTVALHATIIFFCLIVLAPIAWVLLMSIKSIPDAYSGHLWPQNFDFTHYGYVVTKMPNIWQNMANSIIVTLSTVIITVIISTLAAYALVHLRLSFGWVVGTIFVMSLFFPTRIVSVIGIFQIQDNLGLINTLPGLILPYITLNLALSTLIMRGIFQQISPEIAESAKIDGAGPVRILVQIMLPLIANGLVVLVIVNFVTCWGEFLLAATLTNDQAVRTLPVVLATAFGGFGQWAWPRLAALYILVITPGIFIFAAAQRWYIKGLQEGALKF
jgi:multiple sugar transport system permease protein